MNQNLAALAAVPLPSGGHSGQRNKQYNQETLIDINNGYKKQDGRNGCQRY